MKATRSRRYVDLAHAPKPERHPSDLLSGPLWRQTGYSNTLPLKYMEGTKFMVRKQKKTI